MRLTSALSNLAAASLLILGGRAAAADSPQAGALELHPVKAVVELFTSQGCSSCPPADQLLKTFADRKDVLAMSLPVDYWDYIGWKDTLASPKNTERQRAYAEIFGIGPVYTPQAVVNGSAQVLGSSERQIEQAISDTSAALATQGPVEITLRDNAIVVEAGPGATGETKDATIWLAIVQRSSAVTIKAGENKGKTLTYTNVLRSLTPVGVWNGSPTVIRLSRPNMSLSADEHPALIVQESNTGPIIAAAWIGN